MTEDERQAALDALEDARDERLVGLGRAMVEWSGVDPHDAAALERFAEAVGWSSIPQACEQVQQGLDDAAAVIDGRRAAGCAPDCPKPIDHRGACYE